MTRAPRPLFDGKPYRDFVPPGAFIRLLPLIEDVSREWPWPYTPDELQGALAALPATTRDRAARQIVQSARSYLGRAWARLASGSRKPAPVMEARAALDAAQALLAALRGLSEEAERLLQPSDDLSLSPIHLKLEVDRFVHTHRLAIRMLTQKPVGRGRRVADVEARLAVDLRKIFSLAHAGLRKPPGFPTFRAKALGPLEAFGLPPLDAKSWESKEKAAVRVASSRLKNSPEIQNCSG